MPHKSKSKDYPSAPGHPGKGKMKPVPPPSKAARRRKIAEMRMGG